MKAVVFHDIGSIALDDVAHPVVERDSDAVVRVTTTAICGSDLHVIHGRIPGMAAGSVLGHEFVGVVEESGAGVTAVTPGDRVVGSFIVPCGQCWFCNRGLFNRCPELGVFGYGAFLGDLNGAQAEYVRVPRADLVLRRISSQMTDETAVFAGDVFTTAYDCAAEGGIHEGDSVAVLGCGPVGLMAVQAARVFHPSVVYAIDTVQSRLAIAQSFGAVPVDANAVHVPSFVQDATSGRGADVVLECVGAIPALLTAIDAVRAGGRISVVGVYSEPEIELPLNTTFMRGIDLKFCGTANIIGRWDEAMDLMTTGAVDPAAIITHRLPLESALHGYELFESREALKVILTLSES